MKRMERRLNTAVNIVAIVVLTGFLIGPGGPIGSRLKEYREQKQLTQLIQSEWKTLTENGPRIDSTGDSVLLVEFSDYECPYCTENHEYLTEFIAANPTVGVAYRHLPGPSHAMADEAAKAAMCADEQGVFRKMHVVLFETHEWKGSGDVRAAAVAAGVADLDAFDACLTSQRIDIQLTEDRRLARSLGIRGTPTFVTTSGTHDGLRTVAELEHLTRNR